MLNAPTRSMLIGCRAERSWRFWFDCGLRRAETVSLDTDRLQLRRFTLGDPGPPENDVSRNACEFWIIDADKRTVHVTKDLRNR